MFISIETTIVFFFFSKENHIFTKKIKIQQSIFSYRNLIQLKFKLKWGYFMIIIYNTFYNIFIIFFYNISFINKFINKI